MLLLDPITVPRVFGGKKLFSYGADRTVGEKIGQLFTVSATDKLNTKIIGGEFNGCGLKEVFEQHKEMFGYDRYGNIFPFMIDFIDSSSGALCFQTHPTKEYAKEKLGMPFGKNESWYYIDPPLSKTNYCNTKASTIDEAKECLEKKEYTVFMDTVPINKGDYLYIPSGTPHALSEGALVFEIQQAHPKTFNFYDFDRLYDGKKREINIEDGFKNFNVDRNVSAYPFGIGDIAQEEDYITSLDYISGYYENTKDVFCAVTIIGGSITVEETIIKKGASFLVMPGEKIEFSGNAVAIINWPK